MPFSAVHPETGKLESVEYFMRLGLKQGICDLCDTVMGIRGEQTSNRRPHFFHPSEVNCISTQLNKIPYENLTANEFDNAAGKTIREQLKENLYLVYLSCNQITNSPLRLTDFKKLVEKATEKRVWDYKGLTFNYIPYILLTFHESLEGYFKGINGSIKYRFILEPKLKSYDELWNNSNMKQKAWKVSKSDGEILEIIAISSDPLSNIEPDYFSTYRDKVRL